jgi:hypothetical protein
MRYVYGFAFSMMLGLPWPAAAQVSHALPSIGLPLPAIGLRPAWEQPRQPAWARPQTPSWERRQVPRWEQRFDTPKEAPRESRRRHGPRFRGPQVVYVAQPYPVEVPQPPQVIVVQQPPETRIVEVHVPAPSPEPAAPPPPPYVPTGDRTLYVIPGCYVGNVPPTNVRLRPGCDLSKMTKFIP